MLLRSNFWALSEKEKEPVLTARYVYTVNWKNMRMCKLMSNDYKKRINTHKSHNNATKNVSTIEPVLFSINVCH